jgi:membrane-bound lytic murein transglycosylase A
MAAASLCACTQLQPAATTPPATLTLAAVEFSNIPGWQTDNVAAVLQSLKSQCRRFAHMPAETMLGGEGLAATYGGRAGQWGATCRAAADLRQGDDAAVRAFLSQRFQPYRIDTPALVTGYFEPEVLGSLRPAPGFNTPLLARPADLVQTPPAASDPLAAPVIGRRDAGHIVPYWTRADIEAGALGKDARPLFWLRSAADLFFLQVQGSGRIRLPDGSVLRVTYDGRNGRPYTPIGRILVADNALAPADVSMQTIRAWLDAHPDRAKQVMDRNEDFVFFRLVRNPDSDFGPPGALGVDLAPGRSAAVDRHFIPLGAPLFVDTTDPVSHAAWRRLVLAQDIGTDIVGPARVDLFLGSGVVAEQTAGLMRQAGTEYLFLPRP